MRRLILGLAAASLAIAIVGCGGSGNGIVNVPNPRVRVANLMPNIPNAKSQVGSDTIGGASGIDFGTVSDYAITNNGNKDLSVGDSTFNNLATLSNQLFETQKRYTGIAYGTAPRTILLLDEDKNSASGGSVSLQTINAAQGQGAFDVYVTDSTGSGTLPATPSFPNIGVGIISSFADVPAAGGPLSARIRVYATGQTTTALVDKTVLLDSQERAAIVVYADPSAGSGLNVIVLKENI